MVSCQFFEAKSFEIHGVLPIYRNHLLGPPPRFSPYVFMANNLGVSFNYNLN
jgi:hypothetical protein